jgi:hypothetical protein
MILSVEVWSAIASCVSAATGVGGLTGLAYYVVYTKRMMSASEQTLRATIEPVLDVSLSSASPSKDVLLRICNEGNGNSFRTSVWSYYNKSDLFRYQKFVSDFADFDANGSGIGTIKPRSEWPDDVRLAKPASGEYALFVIQGWDLVNCAHQLHVRYLWSGDSITIEVFRVKRMPWEAFSKLKKRSTRL